MGYEGGCFCKEIRYSIDLKSPDDARMSICHCSNCKVFIYFIFSTLPLKLLLEIHRVSLWYHSKDTKK